MAMMTYSFDSEFTPIPYSPESLDVDMASGQAPRFELISEEDAPRISATKPSHAKKREVGHIPRPPNAFILFRSSFIKSESVPGNIEGNHSTLSKIIGMPILPLPRHPSKLLPPKELYGRRSRLPSASSGRSVPCKHRPNIARDIRTGVSDQAQMLMPSRSARRKIRTRIVRLHVANEVLSVLATRSVVVREAAAACEEKRAVPCRSVAAHRSQNSSRRA
jgi:hypothetical protein